MKRPRYSEGQIADVLREAEIGAPAGDPSGHASHVAETVLTYPSLRRTRSGSGWLCLSTPQSSRCAGCRSALGSHRKATLAQRRARTGVCGVRCDNPGACHVASGRGATLESSDHPVLDVRPPIKCGRHADQRLVVRGEVRLGVRFHSRRDRRDSGRSRSQADARRGNGACRAAAPIARPAHQPSSYRLIVNW